MLVHHILGGPSNVTILLADDNEVPCVVPVCWGDDQQSCCHTLRDCFRSKNLPGYLEPCVMEATILETSIHTYSQRFCTFFGRGFQFHTIPLMKYGLVSPSQGRRTWLWLNVRQSWWPWCVKELGEATPALPSCLWTLLQRAASRKTSSFYFW